MSVITMERWGKNRDQLTAAEGERALCVDRLVGQIQKIVEESGDPQGFDASAWMDRWLSEPLPALGGGLPVDLLDTIEGQTQISRILAQTQSGAYA